MKSKIFTLFIFIALGSNAQNNFFNPDTSYSQLIQNSFGGVASTGIPQNFINKFIFTGFIDQYLKDEASNNLLDENLFGGEFNTNINLYLKPGSLTRNWFWGIGFGTKIEGNLNFTKNLFNLIFNGNKPYAGQVLNLNNTSFESLSYSYLELTLGKADNAPQGMNSYWIDLGLIFGHDFTSFNVPIASLFTAENGSYLDIIIKGGEMIYSDATNLENGIGGKLNLNYSYKSERTTLFVQAKNIGGVSWNAVKSYEIDTTLRFDGVDVSNIFEFSDSVLNRVTNIDSLVNKTTGRIFRILPIDFNVFFKKEFGKLAFDANARYRLFTNYSTYLRLGAYYKIAIFTPGVTLAYGGYGFAQVGINTELNFFKKLKIILGTNNILGAVTPKSSTALDAYFGVMLKL
mgnify:FL=1